MLKRTMFITGVIMIMIMVASLGIFSGCKNTATETEVEESAEAPDENAEEASNDAEEETKEAAQEASEGPIVVIDGLGNEVTLEKSAEKVIVLAPS